MDITSTQNKHYRITILIGHSLDIPLPESLEMAHFTINEWKRSRLNIELRVNIATIENFKNEARRGCDMLIFYGHGYQDGTLQFADKIISLDDLKPNEFWKDLTLCLIFACHSEQFAKYLPCPWIAFASAIDADAPAGFISSWIEKLNDNTILNALREVLQIEVSTNSDFSKHIKQSIISIQENKIYPGTVNVTCGSPGVFENCLIQYNRDTTECINYPGHTPFVGRKDILEALLQIPAIFSPYKHQRVHWITGDAGIGKSALLREFCYWVRDTVFDEDRHPTYLLQMNCWNLTTVDNLKQELIKMATELYKLEKEEVNQLDNLMKALKGLSARHIWVLDDLTYLDVQESSEAQKLVTLLIDLAKSTGILLYLIVSIRRTTGINKNEEIELKPLIDKEVIELAKKILKRPSEHFNSKEEDEIVNIFKFLGKNTALFKRHLFIISDRNHSFNEYAERLRTFGSSALKAQIDLIEKMATFEIDELKFYEERDNFNYSVFFEICYKLMLRCGKFNLSEIIKWFPTRFLFKRESIPAMTAYQNGLDRLIKYGFLATKDNSSEERTYFLNPNQRGTFFALRSETELPDIIPAREILSRISLAIEMVKSFLTEKKQNWYQLALNEFVFLESDYKDDLKNTEIATGVYQSMHIRAELAGIAKQFIDRIKTYDEILDLFEKNKVSEVQIVEQVAMALTNKGFDLGTMGKNEDVVKVCDDVVNRYGERAEPQIVKNVARALVNKGVVLWEMGDNGGAIKVSDDVVSRYGERDEPQIVEQVVKALVNKGVALWQMGNNGGAINVYDDVVSRYGERNELQIVGHVASALVNKVFVLGKQGKNDDAVKVCDDVVNRYGNRDKPQIVEQVVRALLNKGLVLEKMGESGNAIKVYDDVVSRYGEYNEPQIVEQVVKALYNKGVVLWQMGDNGGAIKVYDDVVSRYGGRDEPQIVEQVAKALLNKGFAFWKMGKNEDAVKVCDDVVNRYSKHDEPQIAELVGIALYNKGVILGFIGKNDKLIVKKYLDHI